VILEWGDDFSAFRVRHDIQTHVEQSPPARHNRRSNFSRFFVYMRSLFPRIFLLALLALGSVAHAASLPASVAEALKQARIPVSNVGIVVWETDKPKPLLAVNADTSFKIVLMDHSLRHRAQCGGWCAVPVCVGAAALS
jgi:hypothetical protein